MRGTRIYHVMKHELLDYRRILVGCLLIPLTLLIIIRWKHHLFMSIVYDHGHWSSGVEVLISLLFLIPFFTVWIMLSVRIRFEERGGFYTYMRIMPITAEELVTAKFLTSFIILNGTIIWFLLLWCGVTHFIPPLDQLKVWATIYVYALFFSVWIALHHGLFFKRGANESWTLFFFVAIFIFLIQRPFVQAWIEYVLQVHPWLSISIGCVLLVVSWLVCWQWAMRSYRLFYNHGLKGERVT